MASSFANITSAYICGSAGERRSSKSVKKLLYKRFHAAYSPSNDELFLKNMPHVNLLKSTAHVQFSI